MDKTVTAKTTILVFPSELWASISVFISGEQIGRLKFTGSKRLWAVLCQPGAIESINLGKDYIEFKKWPSFLNELSQVKEISLLSNSRRWWQSFTPRLSMMPKTLRKLTIVGDEGFFLSRKSKRLSLMKYVPLLESLELRGGWDGRNGPELPSSLRSLICLDWNASESLPASLTHLELLHNGENLPPSNEWPSSLTHLSLPSTPLSSFPAHLQQVESLECIWRSNWEKLSELPKSLVKLTLSRKISWSSSTPTSSLPPGLTSLKIFDLPTPYWSYLPTTLKILEIHQTLSSDTFVRKLKSPLSQEIREVPTYPLEKLPKSLLRLSIGFVSLPIGSHHYLCAPCESASSTSSESKEFLFPPLLQYLNIPDVPMSVEAGKQLPRNLTFLSASFLHSAICEHLPRGLLELQAHQCAMNQNFIKFLPKSITKLHLDFSDRKKRWYNIDTGRLSSYGKVLPDLPKESKRQTFQNFWEFESCFSNLTKLSLSGCKISMQDLFSSHAKFDHLEKLVLRQCTGFKTSLVPLLPPHLLKFHAIDTDCPGSAFEYLPRSIQNLKLDNTGLIANEDIAHLPPRLEVLSMTTNKLYNPCIKHLPQTLKRVSLPNANAISSQVISALPPLLRSSGQMSTFTTLFWGLSHGEEVNYDDEESF